MAVTSSLTYQFLRACPVERINADVRLLKLGRRLSVSDVQLWTASPDRLVGQATVTYAIP
jgi:acyl-coenzyme A thioesterase PaaI-like protein